MKDIRTSAEANEASRPSTSNHEARCRRLQVAAAHRWPVAPPATGLSAHTDQPCTACGDVIVRSEIEYELDLPGGGSAPRFHKNCLMIWDEERQRPARSGPEVGTAAWSVTAVHTPRAGKK